MNEGVPLQWSALFFVNKDIKEKEIKHYMLDVLLFRKDVDYERNRIFQCCRHFWRERVQ